LTPPEVSQISQLLDWNSALGVARLVGVDQQITDLVLQLDLLNKPATSYANAVYQVFAQTRGGSWREIYTNRGARLLPADGGAVTLDPEIIPIATLLEGVEQEFGGDTSLDALTLKAVVQLRYDLPGGGRDLRQTFEYVESYTTISQTSTPDIVGVSLTETPAPAQITLSNGFRISFLDVVYSGSTSIWRYRVDELASAQDLSNWVLGLPSCATVTDYAPNGEVVNPDPNAQIDGIKWETGGGFVNGIFTVTLSGDLTLGTVDVAAKGPGVVLGEIAGPACAGDDDDNSSDDGGIIIDEDDDDDDEDDNDRRNCNQGIGNGSEGCDPGNSSPRGGSNDEGDDARTPPGQRNRR
jgi:hypothetical protein